MNRRHSSSMAPCAEVSLSGIKTKISRVVQPYKSMFALGLADTTRTSGDGSRFFRVPGARSDAYRASASDERRGNRGNRPRPSALAGENRLSLRCRPRLGMATLIVLRLARGVFRAQRQPFG